jgi:hypothetical protein
MEAKHDLKRTPEEIKARVASLKEADFFGFETGDLIEYLPFEDAKQYLRPDADITPQQWDGAERLSPLERAKEYLGFAWEKANDNRGISAARSISHMRAWLWLAGYSPEWLKHFDDYEFYGKKLLVVVSLLCDFDWRAHDDGRWVNNEGDSGISKSRVDEEAADAERIAKAAA